MHAKTIVALYDDHASAERVLSELQSVGLRSDFTKVGGEHSGIDGTTEMSGWRHAESYGGTALHSRDGRVGSLTRLGVPRDDAEVFAEGVRRGGVLVVGRVDDDRCDDALAVIERHSPADITHRGQQYRSTGWTGYDATTDDYDDMRASEERSLYATEMGATRANSPAATTATGTTGTGATGTGTGMGLGAAAGALRDVNAEREERIPIVEEQINIGKRQVERGGIRIRSYVVETPVEESVRLRDETVTVERRPVDRAVGEIPADAFRERTIEVTETDEEAVVEKAARIREELVVRKDVEERTRTVSDTVRRTEVEVDDNRTDRATDRLADERLTNDRITDRDRGRTDI